ncbi:MAG: DUF4189 domain-containing protein [Solirubrobacteraceae bacterium]
MSNRSSILSRCRRGLAASTLVGILAAFVMAGPAAAASGPYGAIAINPRTGGAGVSYGAPAECYAKTQALDSCRGYCNIAVWVRNGCAAVVRSPGYFFAGLGLTRAGAIRNARYRSDTSGTALVAWTCSY